MAFRVAVVTLLLGATLLSELSEGEVGVGGRSTPVLTLIGATYALTIVWAALIGRSGPRGLGLLARAQVVFDLAFAALLLHATGGPESPFHFIFVLIIVGAAFVLDSSPLWVVVVSVAIEAVVVLAGAPLRALFAGGPRAVHPLPEGLRIVGYNVISYAAAGLLAARLSVEVRRAAEREKSTGLRLRDLATVHKDVIRCLTSGLVTVTREGVVLTFNEAAAEILGVPAADALGRTIDEIMPELREATGDGGGPLRRAEVRHVRPGVTGAQATRTLGISVSPLVDAGGGSLGRIVNFQDLTELRNMEEQVARNERLAAVGRLAAGVAHEIRNPLAAISGSIELLAQSLRTDDATGRELMGIVLREVGRLDGMIKELLDFARPHPPELERIDLGAMARELVLVLRQDRTLVEGELLLELEGEEAPLWVRADAGQLRQVLWNLVRNAAQASPEGAAVTIGLGTDARGCWVRVRDRGPGVPADMREQVFEPFFSTKKGGTGLGLAIVHRIVADHGGQIEVDDAGPGAAFTVHLPAAAADEARAAG